MIWQIFRHSRIGRFLIKIKFVTKYILIRLYKKFLEMKRENKVMENLTRMYEVGKELNWKVPDP